MAARRIGLALGVLVAANLPGGLPASLAASDSCPDATPTIVGTAGDDRLTGTHGDDVIHGLAGDDVLDGRGGKDILCGGVDADVLRGGRGNDRLYGGPNGMEQPNPDQEPRVVGDTLVPGAGNDFSDAGWDAAAPADGGIAETVSFREAPGPMRVDLMTGEAVGEGEDTLSIDAPWEVIGSTHGDVLIGSERSEGLIGGAGEDLLRGFGGNDRLYADPHADSPHRPGWDDRVYGGAGCDSLDLGNGDDLGIGGPGCDGIHLGHGDDLGRGGHGSDSIIHRSGLTDIAAGPGRDYLETLLPFGPGQQIIGGTGEDELYLWSVVDGAGDTVRATGRIDLGEGSLRMRLGDRAYVAELAGIERFRAPDGEWDVLGTAQDEWIVGAETTWSRVMIRAGGGDDQISGTPGDDLLHGGDGTDRAVEDWGHDVCVSIERYALGDRCEVNRD